MTIGATTSRVSLACNGVTIVFPVALQAYQGSDFLVIHTTAAGVETTFTYNGDYSMAASGTDAPPQWNLTTLAANPWPTGDTIQVIINPVQTQQTQYVQGQAFPSAAVQANMDRLTQMVIRLQDEVSRCIRAPDGDVAPTMLLPAAIARENLSLVFDANGNAVPGLQLPNALTQTAFNAFLASAAGYLALVQGLNDLDALDQVAALLGAGTAQTLATFGDSTMWGANVANLATQVAVPPYQQLQNVVNGFNGNNACTVTNYSISGTTLNQMLLGTDGSGLTFAQRIAASPAQVVYCNHGVNDANGPNATTAAVYRANLLQYIQITRAAGKTPVLVTPHACHNFGALGSYLRTQATGQFARIMRSVAQQHGVFLIDTFDVLQQIMDSDANNPGTGTNTYAPSVILPDGVHGPQATYNITGVQLAEAIVGSQIPTFTAPGQIITAARSLGYMSGATLTPSTASRYTGYLVSGATNPQTLVICFRVAKPGMDISLLAPISSTGSTNIITQLDGGGNLQGSVYSQNLAGWSANWVQDFETCLVRNVTPGLHLLTFQSNTTGTIAYSGLKSRAFKLPIQMEGGSTTAEQGYIRELWTPLMELPAGSVTGKTAIFETMPAEGVVDAPYYEFTAILPINCGFCIGGYYGPNNGSPIAQLMVGIGLNASGFLTINQATGPGTYAPTVLGSTNLSGGSHVYQVLIIPGVTTNLQAYVDGAQIGAAVPLSNCYQGGWCGLYKNLAATDLVITNVNRIRVQLE